MSPTSPTTQMMNDWDPMATDYFSTRNDYNLDTDDTEVAIQGYSKYESLSFQYSKGPSIWSRGERGGGGGGDGVENIANPPPPQKKKKNQNNRTRRKKHNFAGLRVIRRISGKTGKYFADDWAREKSNSQKSFSSSPPPPPTHTRTHKNSLGHPYLFVMGPCKTTRNFHTNSFRFRTLAHEKRG